MNWLKNAINNYDSLSESEQAHVDATLDNLDTPPTNSDTCVCGEVNCADSYAHTTSGF